MEPDPFPQPPTDMVVQEIMTSDPVVVDASAPLRSALRALRALDVRHLPVVDNGQLVGMLSDRDLRLADQPPIEDDEDENPLDRPVAEIMSGDVISVAPEDELSALVDLMVEHKVGAVPVVEDHSGDVVGIVSYIDVLRAARELL